MDQVLPVEELTKISQLPVRSLCHTAQKRESSLDTDEFRSAPESEVTAII
jgi:hypothetical protein